MGIALALAALPERKRSALAAAAAELFVRGNFEAKKGATDVVCKIYGVSGKLRKRKDGNFPKSGGKSRPGGKAGDAGGPGYCEPVFPFF